MQNFIRNNALVFGNLSRLPHIDDKSGEEELQVDVPEGEIESLGMVPLLVQPNPLDLLVVLEKHLDEVVEFGHLIITL